MAFKILFHVPRNSILTIIWSYDFASMSLHTVPLRNRIQPQRNQPYRLTDTHFTYASTPVAAFIFLRTIWFLAYWQFRNYFFNWIYQILMIFPWFLIGFPKYYLVNFTLLSNFFYPKLKIKFDFSFHSILNWVCRILDLDIIKYKDFPMFPYVLVI